MTYTTQAFTATGDLEIRAEVVFEEDSPWFDGHFPGAPVLPGVAQLAVVRDLLGRAAGADVSVAGLSRVRFKRMVLPGETVTVTATADSGRAGSFSFQLSVGGEPVASGRMKLKTGDNGCK